MVAYEAFADVYDALMDDIDYDAWAEYYLQLLERRGVVPRTLCDCACGTGAMSVRFAGRGMRVTGTDVCGEMLEQAQNRARLCGSGTRVLVQRNHLARILCAGQAVYVCTSCERRAATASKNSSLFTTRTGKPGSTSPDSSPVIVPCPSVSRQAASIMSPNAAKSDRPSISPRLRSAPDHA